MSFPFPVQTYADVPISMFVVNCVPYRRNGPPPILMSFVGRTTTVIATILCLCHDSHVTNALGSLQAKILAHQPQLFMLSDSKAWRSLLTSASFSSWWWWWWSWRWLCQCAYIRLAISRRHFSFCEYQQFGIHLLLSVLGRLALLFFWSDTGLADQNYNNGQTTVYRIRPYALSSFGKHACAICHKRPNAETCNALVGTEAAREGNGMESISFACQFQLFRWHLAWFRIELLWQEGIAYPSVVFCLLRFCFRHGVTFLLST